MNTMKFFVACLFFAFTTTATAQKATPLPSLEIKDLEGKTVDLQDYAKNGKITVLSFWATWCSPCKKELDAFNEVYEDWQEDYDMEVVAVTIDTRRALAKVPGMVAAKAWEFDVLSDANQVCQNGLSFQTIPQTFLLDQAGNIVYSHNGYVPGDEYELEDEIKALAKKK